MNNTMQLYIDEDKQVKGYPLTSPDRVIDEKGVSIDKRLKNNVKYDVIGQGISVPGIDGKYDDTEIKKQINVINEQLDIIENKTSNIIDIIKYKLDSERYINNAITRALAQSNNGDTLFLKNGQYYINDTITISKNINIEFIGDIIYEGTRDKEAINIFGMNYTNIFINRVIDKDSITAYNTGYHGWINEKYIGVKLENLKGCDIKINNIFNFTTGLCCCASSGGGFWFNKITTNSFYNNKIQIMFNSDGNGSWLNANEFYNGSFAYSGSEFKAGDIMRYTIKQTLTSGNTYGGNSNVFYNYKFEQASADSFNCTQIYLEKALNWEFIDFRHEIINQNAKNNFCELNFKNSNKNQSNGCDISGLVFKPLGSDSFDSKIRLTNYGKLNYELSKIYKIIKSKPSKILINESNILKLARIIKPNYNIIKKYKFANLKSNDITSKYDCYNTKFNNNKNFNIPSSFPLQIIINNISINDEIIVKCNSYEGLPNNINIRGYDENNHIVSGINDDKGQKIGLAGYWNTTLNRYSYNIQNNFYVFTNLDESIKKIEITLYGDIYDLFIETDNLSNSVEFFDNFNVYEKPVSLLEGNWKIGDITNHYDGKMNEDKGWQLIWDNNQYVWNSIGKII